MLLIPRYTFADNLVSIIHPEQVADLDVFSHHVLVISEKPFELLPFIVGQTELRVNVRAVPKKSRRESGLKRAPAAA